MDIQQLLIEKKQKLEELRKKRFSTQCNLQLQVKDNLPDEIDDNIEQSPQDQIVTFDDTTILSELPSNSGTLDDHEPIELNALDLKLNNHEVDDSPSDNDIQQLKRELTKSIKQELEEKYKKMFENLSLENNNNRENNFDRIKTSKEENHETLHLPKTKVKSISICECKSNLFLSIHDDCICIWEILNEIITLTKRIPIYSTVNCAIFNINDSNLIIIGYQTGFVNILNLQTNTLIKSKIQLNSIVSIYSNLNNSYNIICSNGDFLKISNNLIDQLIPIINIFNSMEFNFSSLGIAIDNFFILSCLFLNSNNLVLNLINNDLLLIDLINYKITKLNITEQDFNSPIISISQNSNNLLMLDLNHNLNILNLDTNSITLKSNSVYLSNLTFFSDWISPTMIISVSINNIITMWDFKNNNLVKQKDFKWNENDDLIISSVKVLNLNTILLGDLNGGIHICPLGNVNVN